MQSRSSKLNGPYDDGWIATPHLAPDIRGPKNNSFLRFVDPDIAPAIVELLRIVTERQPDRVAFEDDDRNITFAEFWRAVGRLAVEIENTGTTGPIGILLPTGTLYAVAVFACLAARRLSLLLDENYPEERNLEIANRAKTTLVLMSSNQSESVFWSRFIVRDAAAALTDASPVHEITGGPFDLDAPAFILTTSGSAGRPKALVHSQRTMLHWVRTLHDAMHIRPDDRVLSVSSPSSLGGFTSLLTFPLAGASSQMFEIKQAGFGGLLNVLSSRPVSILRAAPSLLRALCQHRELAKSAMARLRIAQTYGEPLLKSDVTELAQILPPSCLIRTTYGSTEASGLSWFAGEPDDYDPTRVATGTLMPDTRALIVDDLGQPCKLGDAGELLIASRYNALGEWTEGFLIPGRLEPDPSDPCVRIFRTGDIARCSPDGVFVVLGRKDRMAKINGQRVEMSEVETALRRLNSVDRAEVVFQEDNGNAKLIAFVVPNKSASNGLPQLLRRQLATSLPPFMIPSRIVLLDSIPCLPGGKVDAVALLRLLGS